MASPTTGFLNDSGIVKYGVKNSSDTWNYVTLSKPQKTWRIIVDGDLPTDKTGVPMSVSIFEGSIPLFSSTGTWGIQGQSSAGAVKKNLKLKLRDANNQPISLKIGDWFPLSDIILKAFATDRTLIRDIATTEFWRGFHKNTSNLLAPDSAYAYWDKTDLGMHTSALFSTDGFPVEVYHDETFMGLYVLRTEIHEYNYLMDSTNPQHILTQPDHQNNFLIDGNFNSGGWEFFSPASIGDDHIKACQRLFKWTSDCYKNTVDIKLTYQSYIDLDSWIDYLFICETAVSFDSLQNNLIFGSWNATPTSGIWSIFPYDEDQTFGLGAGNSNGDYTASAIGWVTKVDRQIGGQSPAFFDLFHKIFRPEIRARWRYLRDNGFIDAKIVAEIVLSKTGLIDPAMMKQDLKLWKTSDQTGLGSGDMLSNWGLKYSVTYILNYAQERIAWLDKQFSY